MNNSRQRRDRKRARAAGIEKGLRPGETPHVRTPGAASAPVPRPRGTLGYSADRLRPHPRRGAAVKLVLAVARLRADGQLLVKDVGRALKRATIPDEDIKRLGRLANEFAWRVAGLHRYCVVGTRLGSAGSDARLLARALKLLRSRAPSVLVRDANLTRPKGFAEGLLYGIASALGEIELDMSDADLSGLGAVGEHVLADVIWTSGTVFPPGLAEEVRGRSDELVTGVFRVRGSLS